MKIDRNKVYSKYNGRCAYCGKEIDFKAMQVDHMYPQYMSEHWRVNYGIDVYGFENLMPTCRKCNHYKRAETLEAFRMQMATLHERLAKIYILEVACNFGMTEIKPFDGLFYFEKVK